MKIISWNVNGIRSAYNKGLADFIRKEKADMYCFQEIKAQQDQIQNIMSDLSEYRFHINSSRRKKGHAGTAVLYKKAPTNIKNTLGYKPFDVEGRICIFKYQNNEIVNVYMPHGGRQKEKLGFKLKSFETLKKYIKDRKKVILIGDINIAHTELDLVRPKSNKNNIMFTPEERAVLDEIEDIGFIDTFRLLHPKTQKFTWWPYAFRARERDVGWRIDYCFMKNIKIKKAKILTNVLGSDHCPISVII